MDSESRTTYRSGIDLSEDVMAQTPRGRDSSQSDSDMLREALSRVRRIETRLTSGLIALGVGIEAQKPEFSPARGNKPAQIHAPSRHSSLSEIINSAPKNHPGPIEVFVGSDQIAVILVQDARQQQET